MNKINVIKLFIFENKRKIILSLSLLVITFSLAIVFLKKDTFNHEKIVYENLLKENEFETKEEEVIENIQNLPEKVYYFIDIKGYVNNPGVYSLEKGKRVVDAINKEEILKKDANTTLLNLSMELHDEMVIIVYSNDEINNLTETKEKEEIKEVICNQEIVNDACICNDTSQETNDKIDTKDEEGTINNDNETSDNKDSDSSEKININKASVEQLMTLSKIGESKAKAIIEYRETVGLFKTIEDLKNVSGIGDKLFETLKDYITV